MEIIKPKKRSKIRIAAGKSFYTLQRYFLWYFGGEKYAKRRTDHLLHYTAFKHQTPLIRKLKDVDMWMQHNKVTNLKLAINKINGLILEPGETFSLWRLVGKPTKRKGYKEGMVLFGGKLGAGVGGGLCQLSNLIFWMTLHTPLTVTERYRHSYDVFPDDNRTQPFGSGATCVYNYRDLQIRNNTTQPYQLLLHMDSGYLKGEWRTSKKPITRYQVYEKKHWITHEYWGGYVRHNIICRKMLSLEGEVLDDQYICENHAIMMYAPYLEESMVD
jgi:vancomycin resistance protein VanW